MFSLLMCDTVSVCVCECVCAWWVSVCILNTRWKCIFNDFVLIVIFFNGFIMSVCNC